MIPRTIFETEHEQFRESVRKFLEAEAVPYHEQWEEDGQIDRQLWYKAGEQGFLCPTVPEEYGGVGVDYRYNAIVTEEVARLGLTGIGFTLHSDIVVPYILHNGSEAQKRKYLPGCLSGELVTAIAMTEPGTGSDLQGIKTTAELDGDHYVINGAKTFITNGQQADLVIVVCKTNQDSSAGAQAFSLLLVEADTTGFQRGKNLKKIGLKAQDTSELFFQDVRVPKENLLGEEGKGFLYLMQELSQERLSLALAAVSSCEAVLQHTVDYVKERKAFGKPVAAFQNTQFKLAELDAEITAMRVFVDRCLELHIQDKLDAVGASKAKLLSTELQGRVMDECLQLHGGYGYMWEYPVARAFADARVQRIYGGTSEVMKLIVGRSLLAD
ncbi:acyl-CoA dehydrogenase [Pseudomaricurvus alkylphenolicus]|jgi:acyl-CoA dehydrogenase|uniref:acyl-CoA dehydrogenase family protein n=1 Tax=Pseudomaricurvus alkylphenolicus TaxID=1306991 RepID=UPI00142405C3|nr:acyl-CoA dehydrogenase family protein [Pseudomaricurvus alkylphenolicus]NIB40623.1 acyl-CoA dehydrogenase [Pseudomaricurvus alkylphenolicus]